MKSTSLLTIFWLLVFGFSVSDVALAEAKGVSLSAELIQRLESGSAEPVKVVCFGDSVTGLYYHTGGVRAYTDFLGIALRRLYPKAKIEMINAGISGHTTDNGLARMEKDVIFHRPDIVTVMFGLNDLGKNGKLEAYRANLGRIVDRVRAAGGETILCTPNSVITTERRPFEGLVKYCEVVREVAAAKRVPLCDSFAGFEKLRAEDELAWRLTLSDEIHPNAGGHKKIAEQIAVTISGGREVSLDDVGPPQPAISRTLELMEKGALIRVLAMPPFDAEIESALKAVNPDARVEVTTWEVEGKTLREIEKEASKRVRPMKPDLVLIAAPRAASKPDDDRNAWIRSHYWLMNYSLGFSKKEWDAVVIHPSVAEPDGDKLKRDDLVRKLVAAHDLSLVDREKGDDRGAGEILRQWVKEQAQNGKVEQ
jgi:lysophospholipase L1-like esterase